MGNTNGTNRTNQLVATKFVGQGGSGCVFRAAINCKHHQYDPSIAKISKVFTNKEAMDEEVLWSEAIRQIDPNHHFTLQYFGKCIIDKTDFGIEIEKCKFGKPEQNQIYQMVFEDGGDDLRVALTKNIPFKDIFKGLWSVFAGIETMVRNKFIHFDIKPQNMVYKIKEGKVAIIDFGSSATFEEFGLNLQICEPAYPLFPPEFPLLSNDKFNTTLNANQNSQLLYAYIATFIQQITKAGIGNEHTLRQIQEFNNLFISSPAQLPAKANATVLTETPYVPDKIDVYSLGASIMMMLAQSRFPEQATIPFYMDVVELCRRMLMVSHDRVTATEATIMYTAVVNKHLLST